MAVASLGFGTAVAQWTDVRLDAVQIGPGGVPESNRDSTLAGTSSIAVTQPEFADVV